MPYGWLEALSGAAGSFLNSDDMNWQKTLDVDLRAVIVGAQMAARHMLAKQTKGEPDICAHPTAAACLKGSAQTVCSHMRLLICTFVNLECCELRMCSPSVLSEVTGHGFLQASS